jgi:hypothetical protein
MVELTEAVRNELLRRGATSPDPSALTLRLSYEHETAAWALEQADPRPTDVTIIAAPGLPIVVCSPEIAQSLDGGILHFQSLDDRYGGAGFVVLRYRDGTPRPDWAPATTRKRRRVGMPWQGVFRRQPATRSTTQNASS